MSTRHERREARLAQRERWSEKAKTDSVAHFARADAEVERFAGGQPIIVGHHSEASARRSGERSDNAMRQGIERSRMATQHEEAAHGLRRELQRTIYSDAPDAAERLNERISDLEVARSRIKTINEHLRTTGSPKGLDLTAEEQRQLRMYAEASGRKGYPPFILQNLGGNINRLKKRLKDLESDSDQATPETTSTAPRPTRDVPTGNPSNDELLFTTPMTEEQSRRLGSGLETDQETGRTVTPTERWEADANRPKPEPEPAAPPKAVSPPTGPAPENSKAPAAQPDTTAAAATGALPTIENVPTSRIAVRPGLFQARDVSAGGSYDEERVRQITSNWNPERFDPLSVVADPEKPGAYIVIGGHHRLEAVRRLGLETVPVRVLAGDINVPGERRRLEREAVVSNFGVAETNLREKVNAAGRLADSGMDQVQVAREMRLRRGEAERLLWLRRLPPGMLERVMLQPELAPAAAELGRAVDRHGMGPETVQGLFTRWDREYEETGHIPGQYVLRQQLDGLAAANRGPEGEQTGFGGLEGFGGDVVLTRFDAERHTAEDLRRKVRGTQQRLTSCEALAQELGVDIGDVKEAAQTRLDVLTSEQEASVRRTLTLHRAEAAGEPPPSTPDSPSIAPITTPQVQQAAPEDGALERREAAVARRREMRQPLAARLSEPRPIPGEPPAILAGQQSVLGDDFATNRTLSMEMPSFDKGAKVGPMAPPPAQSDPRQTALEPPPEPRRTRPKPPSLKDSPAESRKPPAEQKAQGTKPTKRSKPRQAPPLAKPPKKAAGKSRDTMPAAMRRMLRGL